MASSLATATDRTMMHLQQLPQQQQQQQYNPQWQVWQGQMQPQPMQYTAPPPTVAVNAVGQFAPISLYTQQPQQQPQQPYPQPQRHYSRPMQDPNTTQWAPLVDPAEPGRLVNPPRACTRCKRLKVRCENVNGTRPCKRCTNAHAECFTAPRKQRPRKSEHRVESSKSSQSLPTPPGDAFRSAELSDSDPEDNENYTSPSDEDEGTVAGPDDTSPLGWIKNIALEARSGGLGRAYFAHDKRSGEGLPALPEVYQVMTHEEVGLVFTLFMDKINPYVSMFDDKLHTVDAVKTRSPFLLSVICAIASRYYTARADIYPKAMALVKKAAGDAITGGARSIEHCQAFILLATYPPPDRKYSENKNWLYSGVAFRMATDLGLHRPQVVPPGAGEAAEREALNRTRTWIVCFYLDESMSAHFGRPATIRLDDAVVRGAMAWSRSSPYNHAHDLHLCLFVDLLRMFRRFLDAATDEAEKQIDYYKLSETFDEEVAKFEKTAEEMFARYSDRKSHVCVLRERLVAFVTQYSRLMVHSTGFQKQVRKPGQAEDVFLSRCMDAAFRVLEVVTVDIYGTGSLRYACDGYFWYTSFASAFLLKFLSNEYVDKVNDALRNRIIDHVQSLIDVLSARDVALDASHPPKLFSKFLAVMLNKHTRETSTASAAKRAVPLPPTPESPAVAPPPMQQQAQVSPNTQHEQMLWGEEVSPHELNVGMFVLDHPPWWHDPALAGMDLGALAGGTAGGQQDIFGGQDPFAVAGPPDPFGQFDQHGATGGGGYEYHQQY